MNGLSFSREPSVLEHAADAFRPSEPRGGCELGTAHHDIGGGPSPPANTRETRLQETQGAGAIADPPGPPRHGPRLETPGADHGPGQGPDGTSSGRRAGSPGGGNAGGVARPQVPRARWKRAQNVRASLEMQKRKRPRDRLRAGDWGEGPGRPQGPSPVSGPGRASREDGTVKVHVTSTKKARMRQSQPGCRTACSQPPGSC